MKLSRIVLAGFFLIISLSSCSKDFPTQNQTVFSTTINQTTVNTTVQESPIEVGIDSVKSGCVKYAELFKIPYKSDKSSDGVYVEELRDIGPAAFIVKNDALFLLDSWDGRIIIYRNGVKTDEIGFLYPVTGYDFLVTSDNTMYVFSYPYSLGVYKYNNEIFTRIETSALYDDEVSDSNLYTRGEYAVLYNGLSFLSSADFFSKIANRPWSLEIVDNSIIDLSNNKKYSILSMETQYVILGRYADKIYIESYTDNPPVERSIIIIDTNKDEIVKFPINQMTIFVHSDLYISNDGTLYQMLFKPDGISICKIILDIPVSP